jgi:hypothetical protein
MAGQPSLAGPQQSGQVQRAPFGEWMDISSDTHPGQEDLLPGHR